jgi:hypothetical protein
MREKEQSGGEKQRAKMPEKPATKASKRGLEQSKGDPERSIKPPRPSARVDESGAQL